MKKIEYSFVPGDPEDVMSPESGDAILLRDLRSAIIEALGVAPKHPFESRLPLVDEEGVVVAINPSIHEEWNMGRRLLGVHIRNDLSFADTDLRLCRFILEPSFHPLSVYDRKEMAKEAEIYPVHFLPSRVTPQKIEAAAREVFSSRRGSGPITAFVIGDPWFGKGQEWDGNVILGQIEEFMKRRGGHALVTTSPRTKKAVERNIKALLEPWLLHGYFWCHEKEEGGGRANPYLAYLGLADEIVVTADSLSMVSDVAATGKPFRLVHDWRDQAFSQAALEEGKARHEPGRAVSLLPACELLSHTPQQKLPENLLRCGARSITDPDMSIRPAPVYDTGLPRAVAGVAAAIRAKAMELGRG